MSSQYTVSCDGHFLSSGLLWSISASFFNLRLDVPGTVDRWESGTQVDERVFYLDLTSDRCECNPENPQVEQQYSFASGGCAHVNF